MIKVSINLEQEQMKKYNINKERFNLQSEGIEDKTVDL